jgi:hypothetical protein
MIRLIAGVGLMTIGVAAAQSPGVPDWQTAAGGKMEFEAASVKPTKRPRFPPTNFPLRPRECEATGRSLIGHSSAGALRCLRV